MAIIDIILQAFALLASFFKSGRQKRDDLVNLGKAEAEIDRMRMELQAKDDALKQAEDIAGVPVPDTADVLDGMRGGKY